MTTKPAPGGSGISVGRIVLWGFIAVLAGAATVEFTSRQSYDSAWAKVDAEMEKSTGERPITEAQIQAALPGLTPQLVTDFSGRGKAPDAVRMAVYSWFTLNPTAQRSIYVYYNAENEVVQASQMEYIRGGEIPPTLPEPGSEPQETPFQKGFSKAKTPEEMEQAAAGYRKYMPEELQKRREAEAKKNEAAKAPEAAGGAQPVTPTAPGEASGAEAQPAADPTPAQEPAADSQPGDKPAADEPAATEPPAAEPAAGEENKPE